MVDREHISNFLRVNGISPGSSEEAIRNALHVAGWNDVDVEAAILKLRNQNERPTPDAYHPQNLFFTNTPIAPETLSSLLGLRTSTPAMQLTGSSLAQDKSNRFETLMLVFAVLFSVLVGVTLTLFIMYVYHIGPFYTPVENFTF
jgi:hypothetical protein